MALLDFESIPDFSYRPYIACIFAYADKDNKGYITVEDFVAAVESLGKLYNEEDKLKGLL